MLQIYDQRERTLVSAADALLSAAAAIVRPFRLREKPRLPQRILLLRLERIGDLLMALPGIAAVRRHAPAATIDSLSAAGTRSLRARSPRSNNVETLDARWLARHGTGAGAAVRCCGAPQSWRRRRYDLGINFEPDIRSNLLLAAARPRWTAGYASAGGGPVLDQALDYDPGSHTSDNARRLAAAVFEAPLTEDVGPLLVIPEEHRRQAQAIIGDAVRPVVAMHVSGGRPVKQWDPQRFGEVAQKLAASRRATILLTGSTADRPLVSQVKSLLPSSGVIDVTDSVDLLTLAALLAQSDLLVTGDTGPMHLAHAVGTPIVAVFGPSDPRRYAPRGPLDRVVRVDLPCAPCNRIRLPPARCQGITPDCLALVSSDRVYDAAAAVLDQLAHRNPGEGGTARRWLGEGEYQPDTRDASA